MGSYCFFLFRCIPGSLIEHPFEFLLDSELPLTEYLRTLQLVPQIAHDLLELQPLGISWHVLCAMHHLDIEYGQRVVQQWPCC